MVLRKRATNGSDAPENTSSDVPLGDDKSTSVLWRLIKYAIVLAIVAELCVFSWMVTKLGNAGDLNDEKGFGWTIAIADDVKNAVPYNFMALMAFMKFAGSFYEDPHAREYYESQKPLFAAAAAKFKLHRYFTSIEVRENCAKPQSCEWLDMIHQRIKAFAKSLKEESRDDYRLEKDRCTMYDFFSNNDFPVASILGVWRNRDEFIARMEAGDMAELAEDWPVFLKACHLTQSSSRGTFNVASKDRMTTSAQRITEWVNEKWAFRANDFERPWVNEGNMLTDALQPGILVQAPFKPKAGKLRTHGRFAVGLLEFRVEVIWGRAYQAMLDGNIVFFRDKSVEWYGPPYGFLNIPIREGNLHPKIQWIVDKGYLNCIWDLSERAGKAAAVDYMRVDIFASIGDPAGCTINENSLSSGLMYWKHDNYLAATWAGPHLSGKYQVLETNKSVYELLPEDTGVMPWPHRAQRR